MLITSRDNQRIVQLKRLQRKKFRDQTGRYMAEGTRLVSTLLEAEVVEEVVLSEATSLTHIGQSLQRRCETAGVSVIVASEQVFRSLTDTKTSQGVVAAARKPFWRFESFLAISQGILLIVDGVADPGNVGTILRTAAAVGTAGVVLLPGTADPYSPKVVRASMGAIAQVPQWQIQPTEWVQWCTQHHVPMYVASCNARRTFNKVSYPAKVAFVVGSEAHGVRSELLEAAVGSVRIPMQPQVESLNVAVAAALLLYEAVRQTSV